MNIQDLPAQTRVARPWRNGGGITSDIAIFPDGSGDDDFLWRASIATITDVGTFSCWPGVDRTLLVLRGQLVLAIEDRGEMPLDESTSTVVFSGEEKVVANPLRAPCLVLNLMVRRGQTRIQLMRRSAAFPVVADQTLLLATQLTAISVNGLSFHLNEADALILESDRGSLLDITQPVVTVEFSNN